MKGWYGNSHKHSLASRGIKTNITNKIKVGNVESRYTYEDAIKEMEGLWSCNRTCEVELDEIIDRLNYLYSLDDNETIKLYRIIWVDEVDTKDIGIHYLYDLDSVVYGLGSIWQDLMDGGKMEGHRDYPDLSNAKLVSLEVPKGHIDFDGTLINNIMYPFEKEVMLKETVADVDDVRILKIENAINVLDYDKIKEYYGIPKERW